MAERAKRDHRPWWRTSVIAPIAVTALVAVLITGWFLQSPPEVSSVFFFWTYPGALAVGAGWSWIWHEGRIRANNWRRAYEAERRRQHIGVQIRARLDVGGSKDQMIFSTDSDQLYHVGKFSGYGWAELLTLAPEPRVMRVNDMGQSGILRHAEPAHLVIEHRPIMLPRDIRQGDFDGAELVEKVGARNSPAPPLEE